VFFNKDKKNKEEYKTENLKNLVYTENPTIDKKPNDSNTQKESKMDEPTASYAFYKPEPYPKELVSVLKNMIQRLFPDAKKAFLLEAQHNDKKGYLLIVDIDSKFLKIINIYLDTETKRVRGNMPIECVLYSKSGSLTEGIDPFYFKETVESKANNLASKDFSGEVVFSQMPEFNLWSSKKEVTNVISSLDDESDNAIEDLETQEKHEILLDNQTQKANSKEDTEEKILPQDNVTEDETNKENLTQTQAPKDQKADAPNDNKPQTKVKPSTKSELFGILNEYGAKKSGAVSTVAMAAIREYEFYIPFICPSVEDLKEIATSLPIDEKLRFVKIINPSDGISAVPLFTEKNDALEFSKKDNCFIAYIKYKDFASSRAAEHTGHDGIVINPDDECIYFASSHPLLG